MSDIDWGKYINWDKAIEILATDLHRSRRELKFGYQQDMWKMAKMWSDLVKQQKYEKDEEINWKVLRPKEEFIEESEMEL